MRRVLLLLTGFVALASAAVASSGGATQAQPHWVITDLGTLSRSHSGSEATAINDRGQIVGMSVSTESNFQYGGRAFIWENGEMRGLRPLGGRPYSWATDINNRGQIVGSGFAIGDSGRLVKPRAVVWQDGRIRTLVTAKKMESEAFAINDVGVIVGWVGGYVESSDWPHAALWRANTMRELSAAESLATGLNEHAQVVGISGSIDSNGRWGDLSGFVWEDGRTSSLGSLGGFGWRDWHDNWVSDIGDRGQIVGGRAGRATIWTGGVPRNLARLQGEPRQRSGAWAINERGQIVGIWARKPEGTSRAALWESGKLTLLPNLPGGTSSGAAAINNRGQIVGYSRTKSGDLHAALWTLKR